MKLDFTPFLYRISCALTQGYVLDCSTGIGGIKEVYITELANITLMTEVSGVITAITKATGKRFWKYSLVRETSNTTETITGNEQNGTLFYAQQVQIILNKRQASVRNEVMLLAQNNLLMIVVDNLASPKAWMFGKTQGLRLKTGTAESGTAWGDRNGYTLPFAGNEPELAPEVLFSLIASLETPG